MSKLSKRLINTMGMLGDNHVLVISNANRHTKLLYIARRYKKQEDNFIKFDTIHTLPYQPITYHESVFNQIRNRFDAK